MPKVIRGVVQSNSSDNLLVEVAGEVDYLNVPSINTIPLKKGDYVFLDITEGHNNAYILGKENNNPSQSIPDGASILFDASNGTNWTIAYVKDDSFWIVNSSGMTLKISDKFEFNDGKNEGLVNINELQDNLDSIKSYISTINSINDAMFTVLNSSLGSIYPPIAAAYGVWKSAIELAESTLVYKDMEDTKIIH